MNRVLALALVIFFYSGMGYALESGWSFIPYPKEISDQPLNNSIRFPIAVDQDKVVWSVDSMGNIWSYSNGSWQKYPPETTGILEYHWFISVDSHNRKWFVSSGPGKNDPSILRYDGSVWKTFTLASIGYCRDIAEDKDGSMWCAGKNGIGRINPDDTWQVYLNQDIGVSIPDFFAVCVDANNIKWFSYGERVYWTGGVVSFDGTEWKQLPDPQNVIGDRFVTKIVPLKNGEVAFSVAWRKVVFYKDGIFRERVQPPWEIASDHSDNLWIIVWDNIEGRDGYLKQGIEKFNRRELLWFPKDNSTFDNFLNITVAPDNTVWMTTISGLLYYQQTPASVMDYPCAPILRIGASPNPFNPATTLSFTLPLSGRAELAVYSATGQKVRTLLSGPLAAGLHSVIWDGRDDSGKSVSSGVYVTRLTSGKQTASGKMLLLR